MSKVWQRAMIRMARSGRLTTLMQRQPWLEGLASRFVGGRDVAAVAATAVALRADGISSSVFYLGEYVEDLQVVASTVGKLRDAAEALSARDLDVNMSVDPTQLGLMSSQSMCEVNVRRVAAAVAQVCSPVRPGHDAVILDMEDAGTTQVTMEVHDRLRKDGLPVAVTIQAYLHRTQGDLGRLSEEGAWVRLVKGAFAEPAAIAARGAAEISRRYRQGVRTLLSDTSRHAGCYPSFATHDDQIIEEIIGTARRQDWANDDFEFEMLYGVRPDLQRELARRGHRVRVYLPFGVDWFPYAIRRVGESPRNLRFAFRALTR